MMIDKIKIKIKIFKSWLVLINKFQLDNNNNNKRENNFYTK